MKRNPSLEHDFGQSKKRRASRKAYDASASSSSATMVGSNNYDVFLSFYGKDTRKTFVSHLYNALVDAGIRVFKDDNELREGKEIGNNIFQAINNSKISIPILSLNYASSQWCLQELVEMIECMESVSQVVLPIFYRVKPAHVRYQKGGFGEIFSDLCGKYLEEDVAKWKKALKDVASLKGWESKRDASGDEGELVKMVVKKVFSELKKAFQLVVAEQLVGIDNSVEDILRLLDDNPCVTQIVGIHGMGGIGKTTLAKVVYNKLSNKFEHRSFIADIRESSQRKGISCLQNQMISDMLIKDTQVSNTDEGISIMSSRFKHKKVLILLDDVDDIDQRNALVGKFDWFEVGSKILITTRMRSVLEEAGVKCQYELKEIAEDKSLILFSRHAFLRDSPPCEFDSLSRAIVTNTGGLPLALEVIGSFLCGRNQAFWQDALEKLKEAPHEKVQKRLRISYDALSYEDKQIFLDIACFFIGYDLRIVSYMWDACKYYPTMGIETLSFMSLIKIGEDGELKMHDQLRDLGKAIVCQGNEDAPMRRSRLWVRDEALEVLQRTKGFQMDHIQALWLGLRSQFKFRIPSGFSSYSWRSEFTTEQLETLPKLRVFTVDNAKVIGDSKSLLPNLRWLQWRGHPAFVATSFCLEKLVILDLSFTAISELWEGWSHLKVAKHLKVLILSKCHCLKVTPDLSTFRKLEILVFFGCRNLKEIHPSIGEVKGLVILNLGNCYQLQKLPQEMGELKELKELYVTETRIKELPPWIGCLKKLEVINADICQALIGLPNSISHLVSLSTLSLKNCHELRGLPESIGSLTKLQRLFLCNHRVTPPLKFVDITNSIGKLEDLTDLCLSGLSICELPESVGDLKNLKSMDNSSNGRLRKLPGAINMLGKLESLKATFCRSLEGEFSVDGLSSLRMLDLGWTRISRVLGEFDKLSPLEKLNLCYCKMLRSLPQSINKLPSMQHLDLEYCEELQSLPELPACLTLLRVTCQHQTLPQLSHLIHLSELTFGDCQLLESMPELPSGLLKLYVFACDQLKELPQLSHLIHLSQLTFKGCRLVESMPELPSNLLELYISPCDQLKELPQLSHLIHLKKLTFYGCRLLESKLELPSGLLELHVHDCGQLKELPQLSHLIHLKKLTFQGCQLLESMPELPSGLLVLRVHDCGQLKELPSLLSLKSLSELDLESCRELTKIKGLEALKSLAQLTLSRCGKLSNLDGLEHLESLRDLCVSEFSESDAPLLNYDGFQVRSLDKLKNLRKLKIKDSRSQDLWHLRHRHKLSLYECYNLVKIKGLETLKMLINLCIYWASSTSFDDSEKCPSSWRWAICDVEDQTKVEVEVKGISKLSTSASVSKI